MLRSQAAIKRLERRVEVLERSLSDVRRDEEADLAKARALLFRHLQSNEEVDPLQFAARNDLMLQSVEKALAEFAAKGWVVMIDDETA
jgi:hypothetical protein